MLSRKSNCFFACRCIEFAHDSGATVVVGLAAVEGGLVVEADSSASSAAPPQETTTRGSPALTAKRRPIVVSFLSVGLVLIVVWRSPSNQRMSHGRGCLG